MAGVDAVHSYFLEEKADHLTEGFGGDALSPPASADAIADGGGFGSVVGLDSGDGADGLLYLLQLDGPLIIIRRFIAFAPVRDDAAGHFHILMRGPGQKAGHFLVRCPVAEHGKRVFGRKRTEDQPIGFQTDGSFMLHE